MNYLQTLNKIHGAFVGKETYSKESKKEKDILLTLSDNYSAINVLYIYLQKKNLLKPDFSYFTILYIKLVVMESYYENCIDMFENDALAKFLKKNREQLLSNKEIKFEYLNGSDIENVIELFYLINLQRNSVGEELNVVKDMFSKIQSYSELFENFVLWGKESHVEPISCISFTQMPCDCDLYGIFSLMFLNNKEV